MRLHVVCYSGRKEDERPLRFQLNDHEYFVEDVVDQWYGPNDAFFKVRASDGNLYVLRRRSSTPGGEVEPGVISGSHTERVRGFAGDAVACSTYTADRESATLTPCDRLVP